MASQDIAESGLFPPAGLFKFTNGLDWALADSPLPSQKAAGPFLGTLMLNRLSWTAKIGGKPTLHDAPVGHHFWNGEGGIGICTPLYEKVPSMPCVRVGEMAQFRPVLTININ
jgi:hypothetical protein